METTAKNLFLEAMKLDDSNELMPAASKYLEALLKFGSVLLETSNKRSMIDFQSKNFGDQTKAAMQCLDRVLAIHKEFLKRMPDYSTPPVLTLRPDTPPLEKAHVSDSSMSPDSMEATLRHSDSMRTIRTPSQFALDPIAVAMENNQRLILQFRDVIRQRQQQPNSISGVQVAHMETELQRKMTENLAIAQQQKRLALSPPGSSNTVPRGFGRNAKSSGDIDTQIVRPSRKVEKKKYSTASALGQFVTLGPYDTLALGGSFGERWRSKSGDRSPSMQRLSSESSSIFDESDFAVLLDDGDSDHEVPVPPNGALLPTIEETFGVEACSFLSAEQKHQQQVIIELIYTERTHVRSMKVLQKLFYQPLSRSNILPRNFVSYMPMTFFELVFANLDEVVELHTAIGKTLKGIEKERRVRHDIGAVLSDFFDGEFAEKFKKAVARFCQHQQYALEQLQLRRKQDAAFSALLTMAESHPACHGFKLRDFIPTEMQRLSKYPLLFERLLKYADSGIPDEIEKLTRCHSNSQQILTYMNSCKRDFENSKKLAEIHSRLDTTPFYRYDHPSVTEFRKFNFQEQGFIYEGSLRMKRLDSTVIEMHGVLCDRILLLLTKRGLGADERLRLQFHEEKIFVGARQSVLVQFCPIIKLADAKLKDAASCNKSFYIMSTSGEISLYHLLTPNPESKAKWTKLIQKQIEKVLKTESENGKPEETAQVARASTNEATPNSGYSQEHVVIVGGDEADDADFDDFSDDQEDEEAIYEEIRAPEPKIE